MGNAPLSLTEQEIRFGHILWAADPAGSGDADGVRILNGWDRVNLASCLVPELRGVRGINRACEVTCHRLAVEPLRALVSAWAAAGLVPLVLSWDGMYVPRLMRGGTRLSRHSWGTAFDVNARWNRLGMEPAAIGQPGSVRALVAVAEGLGWCWGGGWKRRDGMHFELAPRAE
jgi:hypothetical protein